MPFTNINTRITAPCSHQLSNRMAGCCKSGRIPRVLAYSAVKLKDFSSLSAQHPDAAVTETDNGKQIYISVNTSIF